MSGYSLSCDPGCKAKRGRDGFLLKNKLEFAKQIVLEAGGYLRLHLHDDLMISKKTGPTDLVTQMDQQVQQDLVEKITNRYPEDRILREEDGLRSPISEGSRLGD